MKNNNYNNAFLRKYRYLLTIARRDGAKKIVFRLLAENCRSLDISLPPNIDASEVEKHVTDHILSQGEHKKTRIGRYLGSKKEKNGKTRYFLFSCDC